MPAPVGTGVPHTGARLIPPGFIPQPFNPDGTTLPLLNNFEGGSSGTAITPFNSGGLSGTAFDSVVASGAGNLVNFDNTHTYDSVAMLVDDTHATGQQYVEWREQLGVLSGTHYGRMYVYFTANPSNAIGLAQYQNGPSTPTAKVELLVSGVVLLADSADVTAVSTTTSIALNQWVRIEWMVVQSATVGQLEVKLFNSPDSGTPTETKTSTATFNTLASSDRVRFGHYNSSPTTGSTYWLDNIGAGAPVYLGPVPAATNQTVNAPAATASASAPLPAVQVQVPPAAATGSASAPTPTVQLGVSPAAATANASAPLPAVKLEVDPPAATASASAPVPQVLSGQTVSPPAATASASALVPAIQVQVTPGVASTNASAPVPAVQLNISPSAATAAASAPTPGTVGNRLQLQVPAPLATASASAPVPTVVGGQIVSPPTATASASAPVPTIIVPVPQVVSPPPATASALARVPTVTGSAVIVNSWAIGGAWSSAWGFKPNAPEPSTPLDIHVPPQPAEPLR